MDCSRCSQINKLMKNIGLLCLLLLAFPSYAAAQSFTFVEFNIAFILGLSLPVIMLSMLLSKVVPNRWGYLTLLMLSFIGFLFSLNQAQDVHIPLVLSFAIISIAIIYLWPLADGKVNAEFDIRQIDSAFNAILVSVAIYLALTWLVPSVDAYIGWLVTCSLIMVIGAIQIILIARVGDSSIYRLVGQWLIVGSFVCIMYFWLNAQLSTTWVITSSVGMFLAVLINGHWNLVYKIYLKLIDNELKDDSTFSAEDVFAFTHDPATNLPSYQQAMIRFEQLVKQDSSKRYAVIVIKPVNFEHVNHVLGHQNSDILLLQLAYCLQQQVSDIDSLMNFDFSRVPTRLARLQSLHFLVVMDVTNSHHPEKSLVEDICLQLSNAVPEAMSFKSFTLNFQIACGIAFTGEHGRTVAEVVAHAEDAVLHAEKQQQLFTYFNAQTSLYTERQLVKMERLKQDIISDALYWYVHPNIDLTTHQIRGFSLQTQWLLAGEERIEISDFIEIAEQSGEVHLLAKHMIKRAFKLLFELRKVGIYQPITINLASQEMLEPDIADYIEEQINTYNISAKYLVIELTEPIMVIACDRAKNMIDQLRALEVGISIDDFTGSYESLRYIRKLSIDQVKINCERLSNTNGAAAEKAIVNSLINLARTMKLPFIGSEINTKDISGIYRSMGGNVVEGKMITSGIAINDLDNWVERWFIEYPSARTNDSSIDI